jgi:hypothetical protein
VPLHRQHLLWPVAKRVDRCKQLFGIVGDLEKPLFEIAELHLRATTPAGAVNHLLVGQDGLATRAPVHGRAPPVSQPALEHPDEQPLVPAVVLGIAGRDLSSPGVADAEPLQLPLHVGDVLARPLLGVEIVLDRGVLGGQPERVPAEGMQYVEALHSLQPGDDVTNHVITNVTDVRVTRGIGEHLETIELRSRRVGRDFERLGLCPSLLPFHVELLRVVFRHAH